jgi:hypothetical protein
LEFIAKKKLTSKVLVVTARPMGKKELIQPNDIFAPDAVEQRLLKSAHGIVKKPFDIAALLVRIAQLLKTA